MSRVLGIALLSVAVSSLLTAWADTIVYRGREYSGVIVEELTNQYAVEFPDTGRTRYFRKEEVSSVEFSDQRSEERRPAPALDPFDFESGVGAPLPEPSDRSEQRAALEAFKRRAQLQAQAEFDAAYEHWVLLEEEYRESLLAHADTQAALAQSERRQATQAIGMQRQEFERERETRRENIESAAVERDIQIQDRYAFAYGDPYAETYHFWGDRDAEQANEWSEIAGWVPEGPAEDVVGEIADSYWRRSASRWAAGGWWLEDALGQADADSFWLEQEYNARIAAENRALRRLAAQERRFQHQSRADLRRYAERANRSSDAAAYLRALEDALAGGYESSLSYRELLSVDGRGVTHRHIRAVAPLLRIDWWVDMAHPLADQLTIRVFDSESDRPVRSDSSAKFPTEHFMIINRPGDYIIEAEAPSALTYTLEVKELRDLEFIPISPAD